MRHTRFTIHFHEQTFFSEISSRSTSWSVVRPQTTKRKEMTSTNNSKSQRSVAQRIHGCCDGDACVVSEEKNACVMAAACFCAATVKSVIGGRNLELFGSRAHHLSPSSLIIITATCTHKHDTCHLLLRLGFLRYQCLSLRSRLTEIVKSRRTQEPWRIKTLSFLFLEQFV